MTHIGQIQKLKLNETIIIHKSLFDWKYSKEVLINKVKQNLTHIGLDDFTTSNFYIQSKEINYVKEYCRNLAIKVLNHNIDDVSNWIEQHWIYASDRRTNTLPGEAPIYHNHPTTLTTSSTKPISHIKTDISYCFYLNVPSDLMGEDGKLMFKDIYGNEVGILPQSGDILFFNPNYQHKPNFIHSSKEERIVICSNLTINLKEYSEKKTLL